MRARQLTTIGTARRFGHAFFVCYETDRGFITGGKWWYYLAAVLCSPVVSLNQPSQNQHLSLFSSIEGVYIYTKILRDAGYGNHNRLPTRVTVTVTVTLSRDPRL